MLARAVATAAGWGGLEPTRLHEGCAVDEQSVSNRMVVMMMVVMATIGRKATAGRVAKKMRLVRTILRRMLKTIRRNDGRGDYDSLTSLVRTRLTSDTLY